MPPPWQCSRWGWMELWATWSSGRCLCSWQGGWKQMIFKVPPNPYQSMILWSPSAFNNLPKEFCPRNNQEASTGAQPERPLRKLRVVRRQRQSVRPGVTFALCVTHTNYAQQLFQSTRIWFVDWCPQHKAVKWLQDCLPQFHQTAQYF